MTPGFGIFLCEGCRLMMFPARLLCPRCHGARFSPVQTEGGIVEEISTIRHMLGQENWRPRRIASVRTDEGVLITVGLLDDCAPGARVALYEENGAPFVRAKGDG